MINTPRRLVPASVSEMENGKLLISTMVEIDEIDAIAPPAAVGSLDDDLNANQVRPGDSEAVWPAHREIQNVQQDFVVDPSVAVFLCDEQIRRRPERVATVQEIRFSKLIQNVAQVKLKSLINDILP